VRGFWVEMIYTLLAHANVIIVMFVVLPTVSMWADKRNVKERITMVKFEIRHKTDNEKEYQAIMDIIKHYEILTKQCKHEKKYGRQLNLNYVERVCINCGKVIDKVKVPDSAGVVF
jgi:hypothetical protein